MSGVTFQTGAVWGLVGAIAMIVVMNARDGGAPPPFAVFWSKFLGDGDPASAMPQALSLHAVYAVVSGVVYTIVFNPVGDSLGLAPTEVTGGVVWGIVYVLILLIGTMLFWGKLVLDMVPDSEQMITFSLAHLAYGLVLGVLAAAVPHLI